MAKNNKSNQNKSNQNRSNQKKANQKKTTDQVIPNAKTTEDASDETRSAEGGEQSTSPPQPSDNSKASVVAPPAIEEKQAFVCLVRIAESGCIYDPKSVIMLEPSRAAQIGSRCIKPLDASEDD